MQIQDDDLWPMLMSAVRYALGRRSYIVFRACSWVRQYRQGLTDYQLLQIKREVEEELDRRTQLGLTCGDAMDHAEWARLVGWIEEELGEEEG